MVFEGRKCNTGLAQWVKEFPHHVIGHAPNGLRDFLSLWRNQMVKGFLCSPAKWLVMLDDDMLPVDDTMAFIESEEPICGPAYIAKGGHQAHGSEGVVGLGAVKVAREVFLKVPPPWFSVGVSPDGSELTECECIWFCRKAWEVGYRPKTIGRIGHIMEVAVLPKPNGGLQMMMVQ
jgi:hypothetical protein